MNNTDTDAPAVPPINGQTTEFKNYANYLRSRIADVGRLVQCFKKHPGITTPDLRHCKVESDRGEMAANITLSFRHLEDASMRLGKAIQAYDGGVSCYADEKAKALEELRASFKADVGHGQEIPKCSEFWIRDLSGNQITEGAFKCLQTLLESIGFTLGISAASERRFAYHIYSPSQKVASFGEIKSVFTFVSERINEAKQPTTHADAISWPAGESSARPFVKPPKAFAAFEPNFEEWARKKAHEIGWQMSSDFCQGISFGKCGVITKIFKTDAEVRDFLTEQEKHRNDEVRAADNRVKMLNREYSQKPFTDESHSA